MFVVRNDPHLLRTAERWQRPHYLDWRLQKGVYYGEYSRTDSMMYWRRNMFHSGHWTFRPPTERRPTTFRDWDSWARRKDERVAYGNNNTTTAIDEANNYMRIDGCYPKRRDQCYSPGYPFDGMHSFTRKTHADFLFEELDVFNPGSGQTAWHKYSRI